MSKAITLSKKHGVNPTIPICFFCGEEKNEIILAGRLPEDKEAPRHAVWDMRPCDKCKGYMKQGIILISVKEKSDPKKPYRTGGWVVIKEEAFMKMFQGSAAVTAQEKRMAFICDDLWNQIGLPREEVKL